MWFWNRSSNCPHLPCFCCTKEQSWCVWTTFLGAETKSESLLKELIWYTPTANRNSRDNEWITTTSCPAHMHSLSQQKALKTSSAHAKLWSASHGTKWLCNCYDLLALTGLLCCSFLSVQSIAASTPSGTWKTQHGITLRSEVIKLVNLRCEKSKSFLGGSITLYGRLRRLQILWGDQC